SVDVQNAARVGADLAEALGDVQSVASFRTYLGMIVMSDHRDGFDEGLALVESAHALAEQHQLHQVALAISRALAFCYLFDGRMEKAQRVTLQVREGLDRAGHRDRLTDMYFGTLWMQNSMLLYGSDDFPAAIADALATHELAIRAGNRTARS